MANKGTKKGGKWVSIKEAVPILGVSDKTIRRRIKKGYVTAKKVGRSYLVYVPKESGKKEDTKTEEKKDTEPKQKDMIDAILSQLKEKDEQIKRLDDRLRENQILLLEFRRLLPAPKEEDEAGEEADETKEKKSQKKKANWTPLLYILGTLSILGIALSLISAFGNRLGL